MFYRFSRDAVRETQITGAATFLSAHTPFVRNRLLETIKQLKSFTILLILSQFILQWIRSQIWHMYTIHAVPLNTRCFNCGTGSCRRQAGIHKVIWGHCQIVLSNAEKARPDQFRKENNHIRIALKSRLELLWHPDRPVDLIGGRLSHHRET